MLARVRWLPSAKDRTAHLLTRAQRGHRPACVAPCCSFLLSSVAEGVIHTDFEKGFICAEVMTFEDLKELGDEEAVKKAGKLRQQGKKYVVQDADVIFFKVSTRLSGLCVRRSFEIRMMTLILNNELFRVFSQGSLLMSFILGLTVPLSLLIAIEHDVAHYYDCMLHHHRCKNEVVLSICRLLLNK